MAFTASSDGDAARDRSELEKLTVVLPPRLATVVRQQPNFPEVCRLSMIFLLSAIVLAKPTWHGHDAGRWC